MYQNQQSPMPMNPAQTMAPPQQQMDFWAGEIGPAQGQGPASPQRPSMPPAPTNAPVLDMTHGLPESTIGAPQNNQEAYMGSMKAMLMQNVGNHIVASFLMGTQNMMSWEGILHDVGNNYLTIYQPEKGRYVMGDFFSLKFAEFYEASRSPGYIGESQVGGW